MKTFKRILLTIMILLAVTGGVSFFMLSPLFAVSLSEETVFSEVGKPLEIDPHSLLEGQDWCVSLSYIDTSKVNSKEVGIYPITIYHGFERYTSAVSVVDTTPPVINCGIRHTTIKKGEAITLNKLGITATDKSPLDRLLFSHVSAELIRVEGNEEDAAYTENLFKEGRDIWTDSFTFDHAGSYHLTVLAIDAYNNETRSSIWVTVEEPPILEVSSDIYLAIGKTVDFASRATAWDILEKDYFLTDISVDTSALNIEKSGDYEILYSAKDSYGLTSSATTTVHVRTPEELQKLIDTHQINMTEHYIVGAPNPYNNGYYEEDNVAFVQDAVKQTLVHIENSSTSSFGSGYIIKIDEHFITIATNHHVIAGDLTPEVFFHDGLSRFGAVVASDERKDIAFLRIPIREIDNQASLNPEYVYSLRTVHMDRDYWERLANDVPIALCYTSIDTKGNTWEEADGHLQYKEAVRDWNHFLDVTETIISMPPIAGTSGSAVFDGHGYFIGMIRGYTNYPGYIETVAVPLSDIMDYYEMVFHEKLR